MIEQKTAFLGILIISRRREKLRAVFILKRGFHPSALAGKGPHRNLQPALSAVKKEKRRTHTKSDLANRHSLAYMMCIIAAVPSQGLNHAIINSHESEDCRHATVWQSAQLWRSTSMQDCCLSQVCTPDGSNTYENWFLYSPDDWEQPTVCPQQSH